MDEYYYGENEIREDNPLLVAGAGLAGLGGATTIGGAMATSGYEGEYNSLKKKYKLKSPNIRTSIAEVERDIARNLGDANIGFAGLRADVNNLVLSGRLSALKDELKKLKSGKKGIKTAVKRARSFRNIYGPAAIVAGLGLAGMSLMGDDNNVIGDEYDY